MSDFHKERLHISLIGSKEDQPPQSPDFQAQLAGFGESLTAQGIEFEPRLRFRDSATSGISHVGEFIVKFVRESEVL